MQAKTKYNQKNAVEWGRMQCVKVDVQGIMSKNTVECSRMQSESNWGDMKSYKGKGNKVQCYSVKNGSGR